MAFKFVYNHTQALFLSVATNLILRVKLIIGSVWQQQTSSNNIFEGAFRVLLNIFVAVFCVVLCLWAYIKRTKSKNWKIVWCCWLYWRIYEAIAEDESLIHSEPCIHKFMDSSNNNSIAYPLATALNFNRFWTLFPLDDINKLSVAWNCKCHSSIFHSLFYLNVWLMLKKCLFKQIGIVHHIDDTPIQYTKIPLKRQKSTFAERQRRHLIFDFRQAAS